MFFIKSIQRRYRNYLIRKNTQRVLISCSLGCQNQLFIFIENYPEHIDIIKDQLRLERRRCIREAYFNQAEMLSKILQRPLNKDDYTVMFEVSIKNGESLSTIKEIAAMAEIEISAEHLKKLLRAQIQNNDHIFHTEETRKELGLVAQSEEDQELFPLAKKLLSLD